MPACTVPSDLSLSDTALRAFRLWPLPADSEELELRDRDRLLLP